MKNKFFMQLLVLAALLLSAFAPTGPALAASACGTGYSVVQGDTLGKIAARCATTISALQRANPEIGNGNLIYPGQYLFLPGALILGGNGYDTYIIARGDTLRSLATRFSTSVDVLLSLNTGITDANKIYEGQRLVVPAAGSSNPPPAPVPTGKSYIVQKGDTLKKIAAWTNTSLDAILAVNPQITNANLIYIGQVINLPDSVTSYTVQSGDTLKKIAARFNTSLDKLLSLNPGIPNPDKIYIGQIVRVY
jgi:peptidoglycan endopeptidase LytE